MSTSANNYRILCATNSQLDSLAMSCLRETTTLVALKNMLKPPSGKSLEQLKEHYESLGDTGLLFFLCYSAFRPEAGIHGCNIWNKSIQDHPSSCSSRPSEAYWRQ